MKTYAKFSSKSVELNATNLMYKCNEKSLPFFTVLANNDDDVAQCILGDFYHFGKQRDDVLAFQWYKRASDLGNTVATYNLGVFYLFGYGTVRKNEQVARQYFTASAKAGNPDAQNNLGVMCALGMSTNPSIKTAVGWWKRAARMGNLNAIKNLNLNKYGFEPKKPAHNKNKHKNTNHSDQRLPFSVITPVLATNKDKIIKSSWYINSLYTQSILNFFNSNDSFVNAFCYPQNQNGVAQDFYHHLHLRSIQAFSPLVVQSLISRALSILDELPIYKFLQNFDNQTIPPKIYNQVVEMIFNICGATIDEQGNMQILPNAYARVLDKVVHDIFKDNPNNGFVQLKLRVLLLHKIRCAFAHNFDSNMPNVTITRKQNEYFLSINLFEQQTEKNKNNRTVLDISLSEFLGMLKIFANINNLDGHKDFKKIFELASVVNGGMLGTNLPNELLGLFANVSPDDDYRCCQLKSNINAIIYSGLRCFNQQKISNKLALSVLPTTQNLTSFLMAHFDDVVSTIEVLNKFVQNPNVLPQNAPSINDGEHGHSYLRTLEINTFFEILSSKEFNACCENNELSYVANLNNQSQVLCLSPQKELFLADKTNKFALNVNQILELKTHVRNSITHCKYIFANNFKEVIFYDKNVVEQNDPDDWCEVCKLSFDTMARIRTHLCNKLGDVDEHDYVKHILANNHPYTQTLALNAVNENCLLADKYLACSLTCERSQK